MAKMTYNDDVKKVCTTMREMLEPWCFEKGQIHGRPWSPLSLHPVWQVDERSGASGPTA